MILQPLTDLLEIVYDFDPMLLQKVCRADSGQLQELRRVYCASRQDNLASGVYGCDSATLAVTNASSARAFQQNSLDQRS